MNSNPWTLEYRASNGIEAVCEVEIFLHGGQTVVVVTDVDAGPSVTNFCEDIATELRTRYEIQFDLFVEHYLPPNEEFDLVTFAWQETVHRGMTVYVAREPHWKASTRAEVEALIGQPYVTRGSRVLRGKSAFSDFLENDLED